MDIRVILNGKKAGLDTIRSAIHGARKFGNVDVRVTWEAGDIERIVQNACAEGCRRLVIGGGDGSINETINAMLHLPIGKMPELAILPLGTANDFAMACNISIDPISALSLAQSGKSYAVDVVRANESYFINVASGGFTAQVTANTPELLKNFLGGGAYAFSGLIQALNLTPYHGQVRLPDGLSKDDWIFGAVCNGRQAGGGLQLAPNAFIDDGLLDIVILKHFLPEKLTQVIKELIEADTSGEFVKRFKVPWAEWESEEEIPVNLDGEPIRTRKIHYEVTPQAIKLVVPEACPLLQQK